MIFLYYFFFRDQLLFLLFLQSWKIPRDVLSSLHICFLSVCAWMCVCTHLQSHFSCQVSEWTWVSCKSTGKMLEPQELGMGPTCARCCTLQGLVYLVYILTCMMLTLCVWEISQVFTQVILRQSNSKGRMAALIFRVSPVLLEQQEYGAGFE